MKNYIVNYVDETGRTGFFDAPAVNSIAAMTDFLKYCLDSNIKPVSMMVVCHD